VIEELQRLGVPHRDPELAAVNMALLLEDVFGVRLRDEDMTADLGFTPAAVQSVVDRPAGGP
jgi:hypothetical protein